MELEGRTALVTGASRGLGHAIASLLAKEGAWVAAGYRSKSEEAAALIASIEGRGRAVQLDVRDAGSVREAVEGVVAERGRIDILVASAGIVRDQLFALASDEELAEVLDVNLLGCVRVCRAVVRSMMGQGGSIVLMASVAGQRASPGQAAYAASKGGILALVRTLAAELGPKNVRVNAVVPGLIDAGMVKRMDRRWRDARAAHIPLGRLGTADEVARTVLFLAGDESSYITGHALVVDGGLTS